MLRNKPREECGTLGHVTYGPPEYPKASSSPTIILLVSGLAAVLGFLVGFFTGLGASEPPGRATYPRPQMTFSVQDPAGSPATSGQRQESPVEQPVEQPPEPVTTVPASSGEDPAAPAVPPGGNRTLV